jgi:hypothetical protein
VRRTQQSRPPHRFYAAARCAMRYEFIFDDGSLFVVPAPWREVYERYFGAVDPAAFEERLRFVIGKYREHRSIPSKFDGIGVATEDDAKYDDPAFYAEGWGEATEWDSADTPPTQASLAEGVLYHAMRVGLLQKVADDYAAEHGTKPIRVISLSDLDRDLDEEAGA